MTRPERRPKRAVAKSGRPASPSISVPTISPYVLRISRLTVAKLGVKLYDKASAVVAELIANAYDADAETVTVHIPLNVALGSIVGGEVHDRGLEIVVEDNGHGMTPDEAIQYYLRVGTDRRSRSNAGSHSRVKHRPVMGRKGIGKLAPFGICRRVEVWSAGGQKKSKGYLVTHFFMDFEKIVNDHDEPVALEAGSDDRTWSPSCGTRIRLTHFLSKRVPDETTFFRQLAVRFTFTKPDFQIFVVDTHTASPPKSIEALHIPVVPETRIDLADRPVVTDDGRRLPVKGWLAMVKEAYKNEEMMGVRIYARNKIVGTTRDFNQPAGFTGEFAMRSYLVGHVEAEWLDLDDGEDLIRTDRQDILWDSEYGQQLRRWGAELIKEIARISREPRRLRVRDIFMDRSKIEARAKDRFGDMNISRVVVDLAKKVGGFAAEDELNDNAYVDDLSEFILSVAPHQALMEAFREFSSKVTKGNVTTEHLINIFDKTHVAELASYAQIAAERVRIINELGRIIHGSFEEKEFQSLLGKAPWLIEPSWTVITKNQSLKTFKEAFERYWKSRHGSDVHLAIDYEEKRPDFTLVAVEGFLHIVEIKKAGHALDDNDLARLINYVDAFEDFFKRHTSLHSNFHRGWRIELVADGENVKNNTYRRALQQITEADHVRRIKLG